MMTRYIRTAVLLTALGALAACSLSTPPQKERLTLRRVDYTSLAGWDSDHVAEALPALQRSCQVMLKKDPNASLGRAGKVSAWRAPCQALGAVDHNDNAVRTYLTTWFTPYAMAGNNGADGLFTGYYEATLRGAAAPSAPYLTPLYAKPDDWAEADLGLFRKEWAGQKIIGRVNGQKFIPYDDRAAIVQRGLQGRARPLVWVDDPVDAFFLAIQGSGRVVMRDAIGHESVLRIGYDGTNGQNYVAIGRNLLERGAITSPVSMQKIRAWLAAHPADADAVMNLNPSYVFFRILNGENPVGAMGVELTPRRSLAVDPAFVPLGVPMWIMTETGRGAPLHRLMVAQDTGGAIKGAVRGDFYWGAGDEAEDEAGLMQSKGRAVMLIPRSVSVDE